METDARRNLIGQSGQEKSKEIPGSDGGDDGNLIPQKDEAGPQTDSASRNPNIDGEAVSLDKKNQSKSNLSENSRNDSGQDGSPIAKDLSSSGVENQDPETVASKTNDETVDEDIDAKEDKEDKDPDRNLEGLGEHVESKNTASEEMNTDAQDVDIANTESEIKVLNVEPVMTMEELDAQWKKLTDDPNYPSLETAVEDLTSRKPEDPIPSSQEVPQRTLPVSNRLSRSSIPLLNLPESVRFTQAPTYASTPLTNDFPPQHPSFSDKRTTSENKQEATYRFPRKSRRGSIPPARDLSKESIHFSKEEFLDENMLISPTKLDSLLIRIFSKPKSNSVNSPAESLLTDRVNERLEIKPTSLIMFENGASDIMSMDPVTWQLQPMKATEKETLRADLPFLEDNLKPTEIIKRLFMDGIITHQDYNQLTHIEGQGERATTRLLVGTLQRRGEKAYPAFVRALRDLDHSRIADELESTERELSRGLDDDRDDLDRRTNLERVSILETGRPLPFFQDVTSPTLNSEHTYHEKEEEQKPHLFSLTSSDQPRALDSELVEYNKQVKDQLTQLNAEVKALHENISTLQTARSIQSNGGDNKQSQEQVNGSNEKINKSSSCVIL